MTNNNKYINSITKDEIRDLPLDFFKGNIHLITNKKDLHNAVAELKKHDIWGFDTETKPSFRKGQNNKMALIQFANDTDAYLFQISQSGFNKKLLKVLEDSEIIKIGLDIKQDLHKIREYYPQFTPGGFIDVQTLAKEASIKDISLKKLAAIVLGVRISKRQQLSNWERKDLTSAQQKYAATDAWIAYLLYKKLMNK